MGIVLPTKKSQSIDMKNAIQQLNFLTIDLVSPSSVVPEALDGHSNVNVSGNGKGLAVVEGFQTSQLVGMLFNQISQLVQQSGTLVTGCLRPRS